jgi:hypothetical protein
MLITLSKDLFSSIVSVANPQPVKWDYTYTLSAVAELGIEMNVSTQYMFKTEFNASIPKQEKQRLIEFISKHQKHINRDEITQYMTNANCFSVSIGMVDKIINDEREFFFRCGYTGNLIPLGDIEGYEHAKYLENIDFDPKGVRLWRLKSTGTGVVNDYTTEQVIVLLTSKGRPTTRNEWRTKIDGLYEIVDSAS